MHPHEWGLTQSKFYPRLNCTKLNSDDWVIPFGRIGQVVKLAMTGASKYLHQCDYCIAHCRKLIWWITISPLLLDKIGSWLWIKLNHSIHSYIFTGWQLTPKLGPPVHAWPHVIRVGSHILIGIKLTSNGNMGSRIHVTYRYYWIFTLFDVTICSAG